MSTPNIHLIAADIASRIPEMARDNPINNQSVIESLLKPLQQQPVQEAEDSEFVSALLTFLFCVSVIGFLLALVSLLFSPTYSMAFVAIAALAIWIGNQITNP